MNAKDQARKTANVRSFLKKIADALRQSETPAQPNPASTLKVLDRSQKENEPSSVHAGLARKTLQPCASFRMRCIRLLQEEESLTMSQAAALLDLPMEAVREQFNELRRLKLIEPCGVRSTPQGIRTAFCLNPTHPGLEFVLGPEPGAVCISQTDPDESLLEITLDSA